MENEIKKNNVELVEDNTKIKVLYNNKKVVFIKPVSWINLEAIIEYQKVLLEEFFDVEAYPSKLLTKDSKFIKNVEQIVELLPVIGDKKLDIQKLDDFHDLIRLFVTTTINKHEISGQLLSDKELNRYLPSLLSTLHGIDFFSIQVEIFQKLQEQKEKQI